VVDALNGTTSYTYDTKSRVTVRTDPLTKTDQFTSYDKNDNLLTAKDRKSQNITSTYDPLNRIATAAYAGGANLTYTWVAGNRLTAISGYPLLSPPKHQQMPQV
jgi:YD repeat-containing protein